MNYYSNLYTSSYSEQNAKLFFEKINNEVPEIDDSFREICEEDLRIGEFDCIIKKIASDCSPAPAGITANFYKHFWEEINIFLLQA